MKIILHVAEHILIALIALGKEVKLRILHIQFSLGYILKKHLSKRRQSIQRLNISTDAKQIIPAY